ncbi:MAG TPA: hypothetical protein VFA89_20995 [Terriglobales bacterium]|nr:hypothetical protein [Terriglobales bacterium]
MSRPPLPMEIQDAKGAYIAHPDRKPENAPQPEGELPIEPPASMRLTPKMKDIWREVVQMLAPEVGKSTDIYAVESLVRLKVKERSGRITGAERGQLITLYGRFALTPSDRVKVHVEKPKQSALSKFMTKPKPAAHEPLPAPGNTLPA